MLIGKNLSIGSSMDRAPPGSKTKRDCLIKDNLAINVLKPLKWQMEGRRVVLLGIEPRTSVLSRQLSLSLSYDAQFQRSSDSIAQIIYLCLDDLYRSVDLEKYSSPSSSQCYMRYMLKSFPFHTTRSNHHLYTYLNNSSYLFSWDVIHVYCT